MKGSEVHPNLGSLSPSVHLLELSSGLLDNTKRLYNIISVSTSRKTCCHRPSLFNRCHCFSSLTLFYGIRSTSAKRFGLSLRLNIR